MMAGAQKWRRMVAVFGTVALVAVACGGGDADEPDGAEDAPDDSAAAEGSEDPPDSEDSEGAASEDGAAAGGDVLSSITIGINNPNYASQLSVILADEWGYFADEGIEEIEIITSDDYIPALIGGSLDITQGDTDVSIGSAEASGEGILYLGTYRGSEYRIIAGAEGIESTEDLVGGTIITGAEGGRTHFSTVQALMDMGLDPEEDVEFVTSGGASDAWAQSVMAGSVDASAIFPRHIPLIEDAGGNILYQNSVEAPQEGIMVLESFLEENRPTVVAYLTATIRARQDMQDLDRQDEIIGIMRDRGFEIPDVFEDVYAVEVEQITADGGFDPAQMDVLVEETVELGNMPEGIDWREHVDIGPLNEAQEALGLEPNPASLD